MYSIVTSARDFEVKEFGWYTRKADARKDARTLDVVRREAKCII